MEIPENQVAENSAQNTPNNRRDAGLSSHNQFGLAKDSSPAFKDIQNSKKSDDVCPICGAKRRREAIICGIKYSFHVMCKCEQAKREEEQRQQKNLDKMRRIENLKKFSLLGERYKNVTFENSETGTNPSFDMAFNR